MKNFFQRNIRRIVLGVLGVTLIAGGLSACGHRGDHQWGANVTAEQYAEKRDKMVDRAASKLDLNAEQKKLLAAVGDKMFEQRKAMIGHVVDKPVNERMVGSVAAAMLAAQYGAAAEIFPLAQPLAKTREIGKIPLVAQILVYAMLDDRTGTTHTPPAPIGTLVWNAAKNRYGWQAFLGMAPGTNKTPAEAVPARYRGLAGLPPTFIGVGAIDLFVDQDIAYAKRLIDAGVPTQLEVVPGAFHAFDSLAASTQVAKDFTASKIAALRRAFA